MECNCGYTVALQGPLDSCEESKGLRFFTRSERSEKLDE